MFMATALTHERRVAIVKALNAKPLEIEGICRKTRISWDAMKRQVKKLERRGFVQLEDGKTAPARGLMPTSITGSAGAGRIGS